MIQTAGGERFLSGAGILVLDSTEPRACPVCVVSLLHIIYDDNHGMPCCRNKDAYVLAAVLSLRRL